MNELLSDFRTLCPGPILRGLRIARLSEQALGTFELDADTLFELGTENIGVLVGGADSTTFFIDRVVTLCQCELGGSIVVAASSGELANELYRHLGVSGGRRRPEVCQRGCVQLTTPEKLRKIKLDNDITKRVMAIMLLDPTCMVHRARGHQYKWFRNDRPQHIARFRYVHRVNEWQPPLILMTNKPCKSLNASQMLAPYSLETWWYVDASTLRTGRLPYRSGDAVSHETENRSDIEQSR